MKSKHLHCDEHTIHRLLIYIDINLILSVLFPPDSNAFLFVCTIKNPVKE